MIGTGLSLVSSCSVPSRAARVLKNHFQPLPQSSSFSWVIVGATAQVLVNRRE